MSETATSYLDNTTIASGKKAWGKTFPVPPQFKNALKLTFEINFAPGFSFDDGPTDARGKVGGIFIGEGAASGCSHSEAASLRLMWDHGRTAQAYTYIPTSSRGKQPDFVNKIGNPKCGLHIWRDDFRGIFKNTGTWNTVTLGVYLNTVGKNDGKIYMSIVTNERTLTKESGGFIWRNKDWPITSISFNSFFGGDQNMRRVKPSTFQIRNIRVSSY